MGSTISYRGRMADLTRIEDFEDRVLDLALEVDIFDQLSRLRSEHRAEDSE